MRTSQLVSNFRAAYSLHSDDAKYTDRYLISTFNVARAMLLKQKASREKLKRTNYIGICMPMCLAKPLECPCIAEAQCYAIVSKYDVPDYIMVGNRLGFDVRTGSGEQIDEWSPRMANDAKLNPALKNKIGYWLENYRGNTKLVVWNNLNLTHIYLTLLPTNLDDIANIPRCDGGGTVTDDCASWLDEEYPLDADLLFNFYEMVNKILLRQAAHIDDRVNDFVDAEVKQ